MIERIVFLTTDRCSIRCRFCGPDCGPEKRHTLDSRWMADRIDQVANWGSLRQVIFSGGEPFLLGQALVDIVAHCAKKKLLTRIVSNGYWASTPEKAQKILRPLKDVGLSEINFSVDDFHQEYIPLSTVKNAVDACVDNRIPVLLAHKKMRNSVITVGVVEKALGRELPIFDECKPERHDVMISSGWTVPIGRGSNLVLEQDWMPDENERVWQRACSSILKDIVFSSDKRLHICCGILSPDISDIAFEIEEGRLLETMERANADLLTNWLRVEGPSGIMRFIQSKQPSIHFRDSYVNNCHLCNDVLGRKETRRVLEQHMDELIPVIQIKRAALEYWRDNVQEGRSRRRRVAPQSEAIKSDR